MIVELFEVLCGSVQCDGVITESPCFFLACGILVKIFSILILGLADAIQPKVKKCTPFLVLVKYGGCIESFSTAMPFCLNLLNGNLAYISVVDSVISLLLFWIMFDSFKVCSLSRWKFAFIAFNLCLLATLLGFITVGKMNEYATLSNYEQSCYVSYILREISFLFILGALIVTVVHDPSHQLPKRMQDGSAQESSVLRVSLLGMKKDYTAVDTHDDDDDNDISLNSKSNAVHHTPQNYYSLLFFSWMTPVFKVANERPLVMDDVPLLPHERSCSQNSKRFFIELIHQNMKILQAIKKLYLHEYLYTGILILIKSLTSFAGPLMLDKLVQAASALADSGDDEVEDKDHRARQWAKVYSYIAILFISKVISAFAMSHYNYSCQRISIGLSAAIKGSL